jgi:hypothetical protein
MSSQFLPVFRSNAAVDAAALLPEILGSGVTLKAALAFSEACRVRGIAGLLLDGVPGSLHRELCRSGRAMLDVLGRLPPERQATARCAPFFDAVAAGDHACAQGIAARARTTWNGDEEYEDDFLYVHVLMDRFYRGADAAACAPALQRWEEVLEGAADPRLAVARALAQRSAADFPEALREVLDHERARFRRMARRGALTEEREATEAHVCVEGLALIRLARQAGLPTPKDAPGVPSIALRDLPPAFDGDGWQSLD